MEIAKRPPGTLHELLALAIEDCRKIAVDPRYEFHMGVWHTPDDEGDGACGVCMAGAIMACTLQVDPGVEMIPERCGDAKWDNALLATNLMRAGMFDRALNMLKTRYVEFETRCGEFRATQELREYYNQVQDELDIILSVEPNEEATEIWFNGWDRVVAKAKELGV